MFRNPYTFKQRLLPKAATSFYGSNCIHDTQCQNAFNGSRYNAQYKGLRVILIPRLYVESERRYVESERSTCQICGARLTAKQSQNGRPALT